MLSLRGDMHGPWRPPNDADEAAADPSCGRPPQNDILAAAAPCWHYGLRQMDGKRPNPIMMYVKTTALVWRST
jgi:hypothetical protein